MTEFKNHERSQKTCLWKTDPSEDNFLFCYETENGFAKHTIWNTGDPLQMTIIENEKSYKFMFRSLNHLVNRIDTQLLCQEYLMVTCAL